jgi:hypothetical protein
MSAALLHRPNLGPIEPHVLYPIEELKARSGMGTTAMRSLRREGLNVRYAAGRAYVLGRDFIEHVMQHGSDHK